MAIPLEKHGAAGAPTQGLRSAVAPRADSEVPMGGSEADCGAIARRRSGSYQGATSVACCGKVKKGLDFGGPA